MNDERFEGALDALREGYNPPPTVPKEAMWEEIRTRLPRGADPDVIAFPDKGAARAPNRSMGWAVAAAAVLVIGVGIGRMTAPVAVGPALATAEEEEAAPLKVAAREHLGRSESLLTLVQVDAREGRLDPQMGQWARDLLSQTRLFLDLSEGMDPDVQELMVDLELILAELVGAAEAGEGGGSEMSRNELRLALEGVQDREVMTRIQAVSGPTLSGT